MLEFEFNTHVETATLVEFFARCGWQEKEAGAKLEWALAGSDDWVLCKLDGEVIGFGRSCRLGPLSRVVFDVLVDERFQGRGLRTEIVRLLSLNAGGFEEVSIFSERDAFPLEMGESGWEASPPEDLPLAPPGTYMGRRRANTGDGR